MAITLLVKPKLDVTSLAAILCTASTFSLVYGAHTVAEYPNVQKIYLDLIR